MGHIVEGNDTVGYRVVDDKIGPVTARKKTEREALDAAGIKPSRATKPTE